MGYKQPSSGLPFKEMGSSPAKQTETGSKSKSSWDIGGYLKGEQGFIPDYKGESTKKTVNKVARKVVKATDDKPKAGMTKKLTDQTPEETYDKVMGQQARDSFGRIAMKSSGKKMLKDAVSHKKMLKDAVSHKQINPNESVEKKYMKVTKDLKMKPPYKKPVGPRAESSATPYASPAKQTGKKSNVSTEKGSNVITNTETGDAYNLKTGETIKNKNPKSIKKKRNRDPKKPR